jgi:prepilin-type N-terminal cleavage/methylation domain-containing protein
MHGMLKRSTNKNRSRFIKSESGFSLVEVVIVMVILAISVVPISRLAIQNLNTGARYTTMTKALFLAQSSLEQIIADYAATSVGRGYDWVRGNWPGTSTPITGFTRTVTVSSEQTSNGVTYVEVHVLIASASIPTVDIATLLVE